MGDGQRMDRKIFGVGDREMTRSERSGKVKKMVWQKF